ncbi:hypothetical protein FIBSPDRAFT_1049796 [Athelia psychrophila]|uniref:TERF2-interacting telomeric protein 1 Myb domain-containing protein n=1 Tax=Athelia psychrophila TaxID=1759441 RepID=A0A166BQE1_9AGAM|nr:hypothetical protein FIBSPDRAFT_1049796 [Fibularhizoctonia sp. CBS 109695]
MTSRQPRRPFTNDDDLLLAKYIARYNPEQAGRMGNVLYQKLTDNPQKWKFAAHHTWQSWRERYKNQQGWFDAEIRRLQKKYGARLQDLGRQPPPKHLPPDQGLTLADEDASDGAMAGPSKRKRGHGEDARKDRKKVKTEKQEEEEEESTEEDDEGTEVVKQPKTEDLEETTEGGEQEGTEDVKPRLARKDDERGQGSSRNIIAHVSKPQSQTPLPRDPPSTKSTPLSLRTDAPKESNTTNHHLIYPDISKAPSPFTTRGREDIPDASDSPIKDEPLTQEKLAHHSQLSHPSQEPTPPLSSVDVDIDVRSSHADSDETENRESSAAPTKSAIKSERKHVFPGGNYRMGLPVRTNTLTMDSPPPQPRRNNTKLKRRRSSYDKDDNFFESCPPTPAPPIRPQSKGTLRLIEGAFGSEFVEGKMKPLPRDDVSSGDDAEEDNDEEKEVDRATRDSQWPPRNRGKRNVGRGQDEQHHPFSQLTQAPTAVKKETDARAEASTSSLLHPFNAIEAPSQNHNTGRHRPKARMDLKAFVDKLPEPTRSRSRSVSYAESEQSNTEPRKAYVPSKELLAAVASVEPNFRQSTSNLAQHAASRSTMPPARPFTFPQPHDRNVVSPNDPFLVPAIPRAVSNLKGKQEIKVDTLDYDKDRRRTFGGMDSRPAVPDIDLAERINRPHRRIFSLPRNSLPGPSTAAEVHHSLPSRRVSAPFEPTSPSFSSPLNMSPADAELAMRLGRASIIQLISDNRRFTEDTIMRVWQSEGSFELADARLKEMWEAAQGKFEAGRKSAPKETVGPVRPKRASMRQRHTPRQPAGLVYTPLPAENGHISDYSPPQMSRAAQYRHGRRSVDMRSGASANLSRSGSLRQFSYTPATSSPPMRSQSPEPPSSDGFQMLMRPVTPPAARDVWGEEEERMLRSGDAATLQKLEARVGKMQYRRRMAESFKSLP